MFLKRPIITNNNQQPKQWYNRKLVLQQKKNLSAAPKFFFDSDSISDQNFVSFSWRAKPENDFLRPDASCRDFGRLRKNDFPHGGELLVCWWWPSWVVKGVHYWVWPEGSVVRRPLASVFYHREHGDTFGQETGNTDSLFLVLACEGQAWSLGNWNKTSEFEH